jgi:Domain of unknown function (DUF4382)
MDLREKALLSGAAGAALALGLLLSATWSGTILGSQNFDPSSKGELSLMITDPPSIPEGVTSVYVSYSNLRLHVAGANNSIWVPVGKSGTIDSLSLVNVSQTVSVDSVPAGRYDAVSLEFSGATVGYLGQNRSAGLNAGRLVASVYGDLEVNSSAPSAALIDIQVTVLNLGSTKSPDFVVSAGARAVQIPRAAVSSEVRRVGLRLGLTGERWFRSFIAEGPKNATIPDITLSPDSLSLTVSNQREGGMLLKAILITSVSSRAQIRSALATNGSMILLVQPDRSLQLLSVDGGPGAGAKFAAALRNSGVRIAPGASATFHYAGLITTLRGMPGVTSGENYYVVLLGPRVLSTFLVTAG